MIRNIRIVTESSNTHALKCGDNYSLKSNIDLSMPHPLKVVFPILLDGDLVLSTEHLGPAYLVAILRNSNATCKIVEISIKEDLEKQVNELCAWQPDIVGISLTTVNILNAKSLGKMLKKSLSPDTFILAGGPLATFKGATLLKLPGWEFLDGLIRGEGEIPLLRFAEAYHTNKDYTSVPSLAYKVDGKINENPIQAGISNLDLLPDPARDQFEYHNGKLAYLRVSTSRGCTSHCTFCNAPHAKNRVGPPIKGWRGQSPKRVVDEVERLYKKYNFTTFDFVDSTFEDPGGKKFGKDRITEIAEEILRRNLKIYYNICMQACNWHEEDKDLIKLLWKSGLEKVLIGIESGSEDGLKRWQKRSTVEDNVRAIRLLRENNVYVAFGFISYHPWSTFKEIRENINFLRNQLGHNLRRYTTRLEIYPGAEVLEELEQENLLHNDYHETLNIFGYDFLDQRVRKLAQYLNLLYGEEYVKECTIEKEPSVFTFETFDIILHTFFSRLFRLSHDNHAVTSILLEKHHIIEDIKQKISNFNFELISELVELAENDALTTDHVRAKRSFVEEFYTKKIEEFRTVQLKLSMNLHRLGLKISNIQYTNA